MGFAQVKEERPKGAGDTEQNAYPGCSGAIEVQAAIKKPIARTGFLQMSGSQLKQQPTSIPR